MYSHTTLVYTKTIKITIKIIVYFKVKMQNITYVVHVACRSISEDCLGVMTSFVAYRHSGFKCAY